MLRLRKAKVKKPVRVYFNRNRKIDFSKMKTKPVRVRFYVKAEKVQAI